MPNLLLLIGRQRFIASRVTFVYSVCHLHCFEKAFITTSVAEPHHFYADPAPAPGENFDAAPVLAAPAPAPTLLYSKAKFLKRTKV
jgi:hypothetical protein